MTDVRLACLLVATPTHQFGDPTEARRWLLSELESHWGETMEPGSKTSASPDSLAPLRSWAVGSVISGEPLLQTRPVVRDRQVSFATDLVRTMAACTVAGYRSTRSADGSIRPLVPARYPQWAAIAAADQLLVRWNKNPSERLALKETMPAFLQRELPGRREEELLFLSALSSFYEHCSIVPQRCETKDFLNALAHLDARLCEISGEQHGVDLWMTEGRVLYALHRGTRAVLSVGPKPNRSAQHTLTQRAKETPPAVLLSSTNNGDGTELPIGVFAIDASDPTRILRP